MTEERGGLSRLLTKWILAKSRHFWGIRQESVVIVKRSTGSNRRSWGGV